MDMDENKSAEMNKALEGIWNSLTDEQKEKARVCQSMEELIQVAGKEGVELPNELLDDVAGGYVLLQEAYFGHYGIGQYYKYAALKDETGEVIDSVDGDYQANVEKRAKKIARRNGQSDKVISVDYANEIRKKAGLPPIRGYKPPFSC